MKEDKPNDPSDHLANERTFLAWIRTSIGIMAFGFVVAKFTLFMRRISIVLGGPSVSEPKGYSSFLGIALVGVGIFTALFSFLRYKHIERQLNNNNYKPSLLLIIILITLILALSILLTVYLLQSL